MSPVALARHTDPDTSHVAAASVNVNDLEYEVLVALDALGEATSLEVSEHSGIARVSASPRFRPLANKRLIRDTGVRRNGSIVWERI